MAAEAIQQQFSLQLKRRFAAPREKVFRAWTDPEALKQWFGPVGYKADVLEMDLRAGGRYRIGFRQNAESETESHVSGEFLDVVPPERLRYTWVWEEQEGFPDTVVSVEFLDRGEETEVRLTHERFPTVEECDRHREGWTSTLGKLTQLLGESR